jgi:hypothetical protein
MNVGDNGKEDRFMEKCDKIVLSLGVVIGAGLAMLVTSIRGYRAAVQAVKEMKADDCSAQEKERYHEIYAGDS